MPRGTPATGPDAANSPAPAERTRGGREEIDEAVHPWNVAIVHTPTPPSGPRRIDLSGWGDLLRAAELLGRPILRLQGGEGGPEGRLFYVADGAQSYVFGFRGDPVNVARSGAYAPLAHSIPVPIKTPPTVARLPVALPEVTPVALPVKRSPALQIFPLPAIPPPVVLTPADATRYPELPEPTADGDLPPDMVVERRIREMILELLNDFRKLPSSSDRLERGTEHVQRAIDMLHLGRYRVAELEISKAAALLQEKRVT
jgi:hypothetical protein